LSELVEYLDERGRSIFGGWKSALDPVTRARIQRALLKLEQGNLSGLKAVGEGVLEMRLDFGPGYRHYFAKDGETLVVLLGGGTKRQQQEDIDAAQGRWKSYKERKKLL
jgi:putative addiction module killer protein